MDMRSKARVSCVDLYSFCFFNFSYLFSFYLCFSVFFIQTLSVPVTEPQKLPKWNYDGSSTGQAPGQDSEVIL